MEQVDQIAVFVDIENVVGFCTELRLPIDIADVLEKLKEEGRITVRRSFGDINKALRATNQANDIDRVRRMLRDNLFLHEDIPYSNNYKNSSDMRLAVEALYIAFTLPNINKFAVISGDSDYVPLFSKLKEQSKSVIGITGSQSRTSEAYRRSCDSLFYFEDISRVELVYDEDKPHENFVAGNGNGAPKFDYETLKDEYANLLVKAVQVLEQSGKTPVSNMLVGQMRQLQSDFDFERANFSSFRDLINYAQEKRLVVSTARDQDVMVHLPADAVVANQVVSTAQYRQFVQEKLKCPLPSFHLRGEIYRTAYDLIRYNADDGGIYLQDLAYDVEDEMRDKNTSVTQSIIFKVLYSLYKTRCFLREATEYAYNPFITGFNAQIEDWDSRFVALQLKNLADETNLPFYPENLSLLFYETAAKKAHVKLLLANLGQKYEND